MGLTVVTHIRPGAPSKWFDASKESVQRQLPTGARHVIIEADDLNAARFAALELDDIICFLDDDDLVINNGLNLCYDAMSDYDLVFTDEELVDEGGAVIHSAQRSNLSTLDLVSNVRTAHHLSMFRTALAKDCYHIFEKHQACSDWIIKARVGTAGRPGHLPIVGAQWRQHATSHSKNTQHQEKYSSEVSGLTKDMKRWVAKSSLIPRIQLASYF